MEDASIEKFNYIKGSLRVSIGKRAEIRINNKISGPFSEDNYSYFRLGDFSSIQTGHIIDMTGNCYIGKNVLLAGYGTQIWTHHFQFDNDIWFRNEVIGDVVICDNVIINSRCTLCDHIIVGSGVVVGANTCIYKNLSSPGLYTGSPIIQKEYNSEISFSKLSLQYEFDNKGEKLKLFKYNS